jgi:hypothetical protein
MLPRNRRILDHYILRHREIECYSCYMNKRSVKKRTRPLKASRSSTVRKAAVRKAMPALAARRAEPTSTMATVVAVNVAEVVALAPSLHSHKFRVGQAVLYTSSPISRPGASGSYKVVKLLPSDGDDYQYRIKNPGEAFERVAKESQLELDH